MEFLAMLDWSIVLQIILIDILLGGDNAVIYSQSANQIAPLIPLAPLSPLVPLSPYPAD